MPFTSSPVGDNIRRLYPLVVIPMLAILLIVGGLAFSVKSQAAPAIRLISLTRSQLPTAVPTSLSTTMRRYVSPRSWAADLRP